MTLLIKMNLAVSSCVGWFAKRTMEKLCKQVATRVPGRHKRRAVCSGGASGRRVQPHQPGHVAGRGSERARAGEARAAPHAHVGAGRRQAGAGLARHQARPAHTRHTRLA